jgi:hypothetical protein
MVFDSTPDDLRYSIVKDNDVDLTGLMAIE